MIHPFVRRAEDIVEELFCRELKEERPKPLHKRMWAELTREIEGEEVNGKDRIFTWFAKTMKTRNADGEKAVVCLMDGERALWKKAEAYGVDAIRILDIITSWSGCGVLPTAPFRGGARMPKHLLRRG